MIGMSSGIVKHKVYTMPSGNTTITFTDVMEKPYGFMIATDADSSVGKYAVLRVCGCLNEDGTGYRQGYVSIATNGTKSGDQSITGNTAYDPDEKTFSCKIGVNFAAGLTYHLWYFTIPFNS